MGMFDTIARKLGFSSEEEDEREDEAEEEDEVQDEDDEEEDDGRRARGSRWANPFARSKETRSRREEEDEPDEEEEPVRSSRRSNVIHDARMDARAAQEVQYTHCERIVCVRRIEECREIIKCLLGGESVLLNLENIDPKDCGRVVDLLSGAAFALHGRMIKVAHLSYLLAPENVEVIEEDIYGSSQSRYR
ncbi:MAG: cell division protein SepF [Clostridia bacterium]|nr:cell division protein SepF [Clostridia bacterium]